MIKCLEPLFCLAEDNLTTFTILTWNIKALCLIWIPGKKGNSQAVEDYKLIYET